MSSINARGMVCTMKTRSRAVRVKIVWEGSNRDYSISKMTLVTMI